MNRVVIILAVIAMAGVATAQESKNIALNPPGADRGHSIMKSLSLRASVNEYKPDDLALQDLSDLVWAANGINRPENGKRTAPSAMNSQDVDVYVVMRSGAYLYNPQENLLEFVSAGDHRALVAGEQANFATAPLFLVLVSDISRFTRAEDDVKLTWAAMDAGIVSQNIALFCAGTGLGTRPRVWMDKDLLRDALHLKDSQHLMLNHPVGYLVK